MWVRVGFTVRRKVLDNTEQVWYNRRAQYKHLLIFEDKNKAPCGALSYQGFDKPTEQRGALTLLQWGMEVSPNDPPILPTLMRLLHGHEG